MLSVRSDPLNRPCLANILPDHHPVGRLDYDSTGLLLFSSSGKLTQTLLHPKHTIEKEYVATVAGRVDESRLQELSEKGVEIKGLGGVHTAQILSVDHFEESAVKPYLQTILDNLPYNKTDLQSRGYLEPLEESTELSVVRLVVTEGKHRLVRRLLHNCGHSVVSLHRQRLGQIELGSVDEGESRTLTSDELKWAESLLSNKHKTR